MPSRSERKKKITISSILGFGGKQDEKERDECPFKSSASDLKDCSAMVRSLNYSTYTGSSTPSISDSQEKVRVFVATWNVGGKAPHSAMNLEDDLLRAEDRSDIYVLGFQEIVPLNAGNVLVIEDNEPAARWLSLINQTLNKPSRSSSKIYPSIPPNCGNSSLSLSTSTDSVSQDSRNSNVLFLKKPSLKAISKTYKTEQGKRIKTCNCHTEAEKKYYRESCFKCPRAYFKEELLSSDEDEELNTYTETEVVSNLAATRQRYGLISCKQMVGIFVTIWARRELVQYISHLRVASIGRGIMGYLGNKGCISISMCVYKTSFCIMCSHLASGEKEGDERRRNSDVIEILRNTQFPKICKTPYRRIPEKILDHDRVIWLGDLNYRISLSYNETRNLLQDSNWDSLLEKDQLRMGRKAGRVFKGWNEGKIYFAPTYKYSSNSDAYAGETITSKKNRRTPAWCDRILWHGSGIEQLSYVRGESRFSDHRPVSSVFLVNVEVADATLKKASSAPNMKIDVEELLPPSRSSKHHGKSSCSIFHEES